MNTEEVNQDTLVPEEDSQDLNLDNESDDKPDELEKLKKYGENQKIRAEKAERELKKLKTQLKEREISPRESETPKNEKPDEPDYAKLAYLETKGVKHPDDIKLVLEEAERLKLPLTDILGMEYIQSKLKDNQDQREAESGAPKGKGKASGVTQQDVEYWLAKGETPDDPELAEKVIEARMKREESKNMFSDDLYTKVGG